METMKTLEEVSGLDELRVKWEATRKVLFAGYPHGQEIFFLVVVKRPNNHTTYNCLRYMNIMGQWDVSVDIEAATITDVLAWLQENTTNC